MQSTNFLTVQGTTSLGENEIMIHPNDGFDLGLMHTSYTVKIFENVSVDEFDSGRGGHDYGQILLKNECPTGTIQISTKRLKRMGHPERIKLFYDKNGLLVHNCNGSE